MLRDACYAPLVRGGPDTNIGEFLGNCGRGAVNRSAADEYFVCGTAARAVMQHNADRLVRFRSRLKFQDGLQQPGKAGVHLIPAHGIQILYPLLRRADQPGITQNAEMV